MDTKISVVTEQEQNGVYVAQFKVFDLFIFSYYVESAGQAYIIDPTFDYYVYRDFVQKRGATLKYVLLTHYHADFLAGHTQFKVPIIMGQKAKRAINKFGIVQYQDGKSFTIGKVSTKVLHTPGHTHQSASYVLSNADGKQFCIFTGDTVFLGEVGRPDLAVSNEFSVQDLAGQLFDTIQKIKTLDPALRIYPGHGAGSSCGKNIGSGNFCNLETQFASNYGFTINSKEEFINKIGDKLAPPPQYFFYDAKLNEQGTNTYEDFLKNANKALSIQQFEKLSQNLPIIDTRHNIGKGILKNSYWITQKGDVSRWISNIIKPDDQFIVIATPGQQQQIVNRFLRIGYFGLKGYAAFDLNQWKGQTTLIETKTLAQIGDLKKIQVDVRNPPEWQQLGIFPDSLLIPLPQIQKRAKEVLQRKEVAEGITVVVNCRSGMRARLAASVLLRNGIKVTPIVLHQKFDDLKGKGVVLSDWKQQ